MSIKAFIRDTRTDGTTFTRLTDEHKEGWLRDAVYEAHDGALPNDWIYETCAAAFEAAQDGDEDGEWVHEFADGYVDVYTQRLYQWQADMCLTNLYAEAKEESKDFGDAGDVDRIQYCAIARIARVLHEAWQEHKNDADQT